MADLSTIGPVHREAARQRLALSLEEARSHMTEAAQQATLSGERSAGVHVQRALADLDLAERELVEDE